GIRDRYVTGVQTCALPICNRVGVDENLGLTYGKNTTPTSALTGFNSAPDGVALIAQYSNEYSTVIRNTAGGNGVAVARTDFGAEAKVSIDTTSCKYFKCRRANLQIGRAHV